MITVTPEIEKQYETHIKDAVRRNRDPMSPREFLESLQPKASGPKAVPWQRTHEQEATFAKFQDIMVRNDICWNGINVNLKHRFENGEFK